MHAPARRCSALTTLFSLLTALLLLLPASAALASHETIAIDGDLTDLIQAVNDNLGDGGFKDEADALGEIYTGKCAFVNGFDMRKVYVLMDYKDGLGNYTPNDVTLYAGWQVEGIIGDTDGDGDADQLTPGSPGESSGCATSDLPGIASTDAYSIRFDLNCTSLSFGSDMEIAITDNQVYKVVGVVYTPLPGATFAYDGSFLELQVPNYQDLLVGLPVEADLCNARISLATDSREDGPGEDRIANPFLLSVAPSIAVSKNPPNQLVCAGSTADWTIVVKNDGLCLLDEVTVYDTLGTGMSFGSSVPVSTGDATIRSWSFTDLAPGDSITITLTAVTDKPCAAPTLVNSVLAEGVHSSPCRPEPEGAQATAQATVTCRDLPACDISGPDSLCVDNSAIFSTTVTTPFLREWILSSTPPGICNTASDPAGSSITVNFTGTGVCTVGLIVRDPLDTEACVDTCFQLVTINPRPPCDIQGDDEACVGNEKVFRTTVGPGYNKQWSFASTPGGICAVIGEADQDSVVVSFTGAGECTITVVTSDPNDPEGCRTECTKIITVNPQPPCDILGERSRSCIGDTLEFSTSVYPDYNVAWSVVEDPTGTCVIVGPTDEGTVKVALTGAGSCTLYLDVTDPADPKRCASRCERILTAVPPPPCDIDGPDAVCVDNSGVFTTTVTDPYLREWVISSTPADICNTASDLTGASITVNFTGAGVCTVGLIVRDPLNTDVCVDTCYQLVTITERPPCDIQGDDEACVGNVKVFRTTAGAGYDKNWSVIEDPAGTCTIIGATDLDSVVVSFTGAGECTVTVAISDPNDPEGCRTECAKVVTVNEQPPCDITGIRGTDPVTRSCVGDTLEFFTSVYPAYNVAWSAVDDPDGVCVIVGPTDEGSVKVAFTGAGSCTLYLDVTDPADPELCASRCQLILTADPLPPCDIEGPTEAAPGDTIEICTPVDGALYDFEWSVVSDPADICVIDGPVDGDCVKIILTGSGECTVTLKVTDPNNPDVCYSTCDYVVRVSGGFACPHTIGFWRQQCAQKSGGSTKVCKAGMDNLWRCVIEATGVIQWKKNDGGFETTASLAALSNSSLFDRLCSQLQGPRPMTGLDMAEVQYLGLMLNVCSGALPLNTPISNSFSGTVAEAIEAIENAINTGVNVGYWKNVADEINNRIGVLAEDCEGGNALFENLPPCGAESAPVEFGSESVGNLDLVQTRPFPNPVLNNAATIFYNIPARLGAADVSIVLFDVSGRAVRTLVSDNKAAGQYTVDWDLRDDSGSDVVSGIYFYRLTVGNETITEKMMVVRK